jgi:hypothetical protein
MSSTRRLLQSTGSQQGPWKYIADLSVWSLTIDQAESGATFTVEVANLPNEPDDPPPSSFAGCNLNNGLFFGPSSVTGGMVGPIFLGSCIACWMRVTKTASDGPLLSTAVLHGHAFS